MRTLSEGLPALQHRTTQGPSEAASYNKVAEETHIHSPACPQEVLPSSRSEL